MVERIIEFSIKNKLFIGILTLTIIGCGIFSLINLPVDAIPDITNNQVQIISMAPSLAVQEVESFITAPIEVAVANIPDIIELRSISRLGLSVVTVVFRDGVDIYWARQQLSERLKDAEDAIPPGLARIELAPVSSGLGEIFQYRLSTDKGFAGKYSPMELRSMQDWIVRRGLLGTQGVADINSYGGYVKQYEVAVNPERLKGMNITLKDVFEALENNNENTGSAYIDKKPTAYFIRGIGLAKSLEDIQKIVVKPSLSGVPVLIRDVAIVRYGSAARFGAFVVDSSEAVGGVVMMLKGANAHEVVDNVERRIQTIQKTLPAGVKVEPFLNRSDLVGRAVNTVTGNLIEGALIVIFILVLMLGNLRAGLIVSSVIPLSMLFAVSLMRLFGVSGNLMSLGAIDFGLIVDGAVIIVESVVYRISGSRHHPTGPGKLSQFEMDGHVFESAKRMMNSATFGQVIILVVYLPVLALVGIEGKMFRPMAQVVSFALIGAAILSLTYVPMATALFLNKNISRSANLSDKIVEMTHRIFRPVIYYAINHRLQVSLVAILLFFLSILVFWRLGGEFIPRLEEGDLAAGVITLQGGSLSNTIEVVEKANKILLANFPEIKHVVCKIGAGEIPTDPTPMETGDYIITLKPKSEWTSAKTREELVAKMQNCLIVMAGVKFEFQQPIQMRFNELLSGSKQDIAIKIFGDDLDILTEKASQTEKIIRSIDGVEDVNAEKVTGLAQVQVNLDRERLAQYGLSVKEVNKVLRTAFAGNQAGVVYDQEKRFGLVVRLGQEYRQSIDDIKSLAIMLPNGGQIPVGQIANVAIKSGPAQVSRENTRRRITIGFNVRGRDIQSVIDQVTFQISRQVTLPVGYFIEYGGQFQNLEAAKKRLAYAIPLALLLIFVLLYFSFRSVRQSLLIFSAVPFAAIGGVFALWIRGMNFSVSAGVGFIALFGVAVLNGIVLITEFNRLEREGVSNVTKRVLEGLQIRLRPVLMTAAVASLGFLPMAISTSAGAEVQKPLATVVIGGLVTATLLTLVILPVFYILSSGGKKMRIIPKKKPSGSTVLIIIATLLPLAGTFGQKGFQRIELKRAILIALDSNQALRAARYSTEAENALKSSSWDIPKTSVNGEYGQINSYANDNRISISQSIEFPAVYINKYRYAVAGVKSSEWRSESAQVEVVRKVKQVYWELVYLISKQKLIRYQDSLYDGFLRAATLRAASGETNRLEMITSRSQSLEVKNHYQEIISDIETNTRKLQVLLNTGIFYIPADTVLTRNPLNPIADSSLVKINPNIAYMKQQTVLSGLEKKVELSRMYPDLSIGYFSQTMLGLQDGNGVQQGFGNNDRYIGVQAGIMIPIWFLPYTSKAKAAAIREKASHEDAGNYEKMILGDYNILLNQYHKYSNSIDYYEKQAIPEADLIISQATMSYKSGDMDYTDYIINLGRGLQIKEGYLRSLNDYNQVIVSIESLQGKIY